jgi:hypothetical protein
MLKNPLVIVVIVIAFAAVLAHQLGLLKGVRNPLAPKSQVAQAQAEQKREEISVIVIQVGVAEDVFYKAKHRYQRDINKLLDVIPSSKKLRPTFSKHTVSFTPMSHGSKIEVAVDRNVTQTFTLTQKHHRKIYTCNAPAQLGCHDGHWLPFASPK